MAQRERPDTNGDIPTADSDEEMPVNQTRLSFFDTERSLTPQVLSADPIANMLKRLQWRDRQDHGRLMYEEMYEHAACQVPFQFILAFLKSVEFRFAADQEEPSKQQVEMAEFLNDQLNRLPWTKIVDGWFGQALQFGFSLAELSTTIEKWKGRPFVQVDGLTPLPQATLDQGPVPIEDEGEIVDETDIRYTCFEFDDDGRVESYHQFRGTQWDRKETISWESDQEKLQVLHLKYRGGDGNPFGESIYYTAFKHWSDLYMLERQEQVFLEHAQPYLTASFDDPDGSPQPEKQKRVEVLVDKAHPYKRLLSATNAEFGKVTASDLDYAEHVDMRKNRLISYIAQSVLVPQPVFAPTDLEDLDTRNFYQIFFRFILPSIITEIGEAMEDQFGKRLVDANWSNVEERDYPSFEYRIHLTSDLRASMGLIQQILPHVDTERLGEFAESMIPGFNSEWVATDHETSISRDRPTGQEDVGLEDPNPDEPPQKEEGETREDTSKPDGTIGQQSRTEV